MPIREPDCLSVATTRKTVWSVHAVRSSERAGLSARLGEKAALFAEQCGFVARPGQLVLVPGEADAPVALLGIAEKAGDDATTRDPFGFGPLAAELPAGNWAVQAPAGIPGG